ncbi:MAG TPA: hypothetical protein ENJ01_02915 [Gammaproteobacteria bacterium]|nr:hypothetical protein [Gammaproteobacteria bacterium]
MILRTSGPVAADPVVEVLEGGLARVRGSLLLTGERLITGWTPRHTEELTAEHLDAALALEPELILLGTGARQRFPAPAILARPQARGIGMEVMATAEACRTFNILVAEGRPVVAALMMI